MLAELKQPPEVPLGLRMAARRLVRAGWAKAEVRHALVAQREMEAAWEAAAAEAGWLSRVFPPWRPGVIFKVVAPRPHARPPARTSSLGGRR